MHDDHPQPHHVHRHHETDTHKPAIKPYEIDPGNFGYTIYTMQDQNRTTVATILVTNTGYTAGGVTFAANTHYWNITNLSALTAATSITLSGAGYQSWASNFSFTFTCSNGAQSWVTSSAPSQSSTNLEGTDGSGNPVVLNTSGLSHDSSGYHGSIVWYYTSNAQNVTVGAGGSGGFTMTGNASIPSATWYTASDSPR